MSSLQKLIVPIDFSDTSRAALQLACTIARGAHSEVHLLHVIPDPLQIPWIELNPGIEYYVRMEESWKADAHRRLQNLGAQEGLAAGEFVCVVSIGHPARIILEYAHEQHAGLVVMGAQGHGAMARLLLGSVAERVVRHACVPVLTVPRGRVEVQARSETPSRRAS